ncbi:hypothetical protein K470DRAFT_264396 [Piedraia hortae CBS 480.64]|uniref:Uncharacterized protein n=1 Tax=Piedraia hortae CBS 480.64 TaxID=1314780 RepID=A0A6A7BZN4_9PEZI|nr:hypothetical protein K470DRAFT_264396 [Piedraia hortae CBS 480.64]
MLLSIILSEIRRGNDETVRLTASLNRLNETMNALSKKLSESMDEQSTILATIKLSAEDRPIQQTAMGRAGSEEWFYKGLRLSKKYHVFACIISQLMSILHLHIEHQGIRYLDSVDCQPDAQYDLSRAAQAVEPASEDIRQRSITTRTLLYHALTKGTTTSFIFGI